MNYATFRNNEIISIAGIVVFIVAIFLFSRIIDLDSIAHQIESAGIWAPLLFILAKASTVFFAPISGSPLYILVGTLFGVGEGILYSFLGDLLGFSMIFFVSRMFGLNLIKKILGQSEDKIMEIVHKHTGNAKIFIRTAVLFFWFPELVIASTGLSKMSYIKVFSIFMPFYVLGTSIYIIISTKILAF